jgi:hypothetical protein
LALPPLTELEVMSCQPTALQQLVSELQFVTDFGIQVTINCPAATKPSNLLPQDSQLALMVSNAQSLMIKACLTSRWSSSSGIHFSAQSPKHGTGFQFAYGNRDSTNISVGCLFAKLNELSFNNLDQLYIEVLDEDQFCDADIGDWRDLFSSISSLTSLAIRLRGGLFELEKDNSLLLALIHDPWVPTQHTSGPILPNLERLALIDVKPGYFGLDVLTSVLRMRLYDGNPRLQLLKLSCQDFCREGVLQRAVAASKSACRHLVKDVYFEASSFEPSGGVMTCLLPANSP